MIFGCAIRQVWSEAKACVCKRAHEAELPRENMRKKQPGMMKCLCLGTLITPQIPSQNHSAVVISTHSHTHTRSEYYIQADFAMEKFCFRVTHCYVHWAFHKRPIQNVHSRWNHPYKWSYTCKLLHTYKLCQCEAYCFMADHRIL